MALSSDEFEELSTIMNAVVEVRGKLGSWDQKFFDDQYARFEKYGNDTRLSPKQWVHLRRIYEENIG